MNKKKKISIVTPCYNAETYIKECIESVKCQTYDNYEHIIVDGASTDCTIKIIRAFDGCYPMQYISEKDDGMYDAIVKGFSIASGDIFCWLNSDDMFVQKGTLDIVNDVIGRSVPGGHNSMVDGYSNYLQCVCN